MAGKRPLVPPTAGAALTALQQRLGYTFKDTALLRQALTHRSASSDNLERFEFLGDAALGFLIARILFHAVPKASEHQLTLMRASLVRKESLADVAREIDLGGCLRLGMGERKSGVARRASILADAFEALVGAVICDGGLEGGEGLVRRLFHDRIAAVADRDLKDPKTRLQEYLQMQHLAPPTYAIVERTGPDHARMFTVVCEAAAAAVQAKGRGRSRRDAEKAAADAVLRQLYRRQPAGHSAPGLGTGTASTSGRTETASEPPPARTVESPAATTPVARST